MDEHRLCWWNWSSFSFIIHNTNTTSVVTAPPPVEIPKVEFKVPSWKCPDCTPEEQYVLSELQEHTRITDRNALATIMGNIKQESKFIPNICEGGAEFLTGIVIAVGMVLFSGPQ